MKTRMMAGMFGCLLLWSCAQGQQRADEGGEPAVKAWNEMRPEFPAYPGADKLITLDVGSATGHHFFVDPDSVSVGSDGVVRYTLVIKTAGGATNVSFEGIRCETREQKYYATGRADKIWVPARNPQWRYIEYKEVNAQHITLYGEYLCRREAVAGTAEQMVQTLRRGPQQSGRDG